MLHLLLLTIPPAIETPSHPNLVVNGDFSAGNVGFTNGYRYTHDIIMDGDYYVGSNPHESHPGGASMGDHTSGKGMMLMVNGSQTDNTAVWEETIKVSPNHKYTFALWAASWSMSMGNSLGPGDASPARLVVYVNGKMINRPFTVDARDAIWTKLVASWSSGTAKTADIRIVDANLDGFGNDFAIDDIAFHE